MGIQKPLIYSGVAVLLSFGAIVTGEQSLAMLSARKYLRGLKQVFPIINCGTNKYANYCILGGGAKVGNLTGTATTIGSVLIPNGDDVGSGVVINNAEQASYVNGKNQTESLGVFITPIYSEIFNASLGAGGFAVQPAGWTREGNGTLDGGVENRVIGYFAYPVDSGTGAPNTQSDYFPGSVGLADVTTTGNSDAVTATSFGGSLPGGNLTDGFPVYINHPVRSGLGLTFPP